MTQPSPAYHSYQPVPPPYGYPPPPKQSGGGLTSVLAAVFALVAAGLAIGGSFAPISTYSSGLELDGEETLFATTSGWWVNENTGFEEAEDSGTVVGLSLVLVATLLVLGAVFAFVAARTRTPGPTTGGRSLISAGVGALAGVMILRGVATLEEAALLNERDLEPGESLDFSPGLGLFLPLGGLAAGLIAVVLAHVGQRARARVEPNTPRMGFRAPYGYQQQGPAETRMPMGAPPAAAVSHTPDPGPARTSPPAQNADDTTDDNTDADDTQVVPNATAGGPAEAAATPAAPELRTEPGDAAPPTTPHHTAPHHTPAGDTPAGHAAADPKAVGDTAPHHTAPDHTAPHHTAPHHTAADDAPAGDTPAGSVAGATPPGSAGDPPPTTPAGDRTPSHLDGPAPAAPAGTAAAEAPRAPEAAPTPAGPSAPTGAAHHAGDAPVAGPASAPPPAERKPLTDLPPAPPAPELTKDDPKDGR